jgi:hypothetical protein
MYVTEVLQKAVETKDITDVEAEIINIVLNILNKKKNYLTI